ncbi:MAG: type I polyketide synthase, partial [Betaproteobacteria bacterium]|nr:type I polyketide synthase [Betaproteobacteria bacterium]
SFDAGVLSDIDAFDAGFFGISPREAQLLDPQQRLLLELGWQAFEHAGIKPSAAAGSDCAVYLGISGLDYGMRLLDDLSVLGAHTMTGNTMSVAANRLSYVFDLRGPSVAVDTACSSSLVALHHACQALREGQCGMALAGGVNLLLHPYPFVGFTKASMLSAQGRCRPFTEGADGYVRAEGGALLLLKPLRRALDDGDTIHGVIRASGVNTDGARKSGLTIPSGAAQAELMRGVLAQAGLRPDDIDYVEAHGTGTRIGDPIEAGAIGAVYGRAGSAQPLPIGSIKSNLGHLEPASGMAGLLKALLSLRHASVPPTRVSGRLNPDIDFDALGLRVVQQPTALPAGARPLRAAVNSFGFGGVNAHVILEQAPEAAPTQAPSQAPAACPLLLGAHDPAALRALARAYAERLEHETPAGRAAVARAAWQQREWLPERLALPDATDPGAAQALRDFADAAASTRPSSSTASTASTASARSAASAPAPALHERALAGQAAPSAPLAFVYSGNGAQWVGMGRRLRGASPAFEQALLDTARRIAALGGPDVLGALDDDRPEALDDTAVAQPALFALQVAATCALRELGLRPEAAMGHSVGEIAAAWAAGALELDDACRVIVARSAAQAATRGTGRMAAVGLGAQALQQRLHALGLADALQVG